MKEKNYKNTIPEKISTKIKISIFESKNNLKQYKDSLNRLNRS